MAETDGAARRPSIRMTQATFSSATLAMIATAV